MSFPASAIPGVLAVAPALVETIYPNGDDVVGAWEDEGGATTNLFQSVDSESDADWVELRNANHIVTSGTRTLRLLMATPSDDPSPTQTVEVKVRCEWIDVLNGIGPGDLDAGDPNITIYLFEGTTQRAVGSATQITETPAEYSLFLDQSEITSVTDWSQVRVQAAFEASGIPIDEEVDIRVYRMRIVFDE